MSAYTTNNLYDTATISIHTGIDNGRDDRSELIYAVLRDSEGNLLINATLEYIVSNWRNRRTPAAKLAEDDYKAGLLPRYTGSGFRHVMSIGDRVGNLAFDQEYARRYVNAYRELEVK